MISFLATLFVGFLVSVTAFAGDVSNNYATQFCPRDAHTCRVSFRHIEGGGIGYEQGYSTLEGFFAPDPQLWKAMPFLDIRGHIFDDGKGAANIGVGLRKMAERRVYGLNLYYDYRNTCRLHYNQVGFGFEALGNHCDFRINGYLPAGNTITCPYAAEFAGFAGNQMLVLQKYQFAMKGFNAELGFDVGHSRFCDFYAAVGPYYYTGEIGPNIWGGLARFVCRFSEYGIVEFRNSFDKMFRNKFQCQITFTIPFGSDVEEDSTTRESCHRAYVSSAMVRPVEREEIIVVGCRKKSTVATNAITGQPFNFVFVNNMSNSQGTYESPYPTLAQAQAHSKSGDIIYVFSGDGTTRGMDVGITLKNNQKFWGSGNSHTLQTAQGNFIIPAQTSLVPTMTNVDGNAITLASVNQVSGFTMTSPLGNGIVGSNVKHSEIGECTISGTSSGIVIDSTVDSAVCTVSNCVLQDNA